MKIESIVQVIQEACLKAGKHIAVRLQQGDLQSSRKSDNSLVTAVDLVSDAVLRNDLSGLASLLSEEDPASHSVVSKDEFISIDPLDGTSACKHFGLQRGGQVGFGPLVGLFRSGSVHAAVYFDIPGMQLFSAVRGTGVSVCAVSSDFVLGSPRILSRSKFPKLQDSVVLFYTGKLGEMRIVEAMRKEGLIESAYRFGGIANDCARVAIGYEDIIIQFYAKVWDFPALLLAHEAGLSVVCDPLGQKVAFSDWQVKMDNPILVAPPQDAEFLLDYCSRTRG